MKKTGDHSPAEARRVAEKLILQIREGYAAQGITLERGEIIEIEPTYLEVRIYIKELPGEWETVMVGEPLPKASGRN